MPNDLRKRLARSLRSRSIRWRITWQAGVIALITQGFVVAVIITVQWRNRDDLFSSQLVNRAYFIADAIYRRAGPLDDDALLDVSRLPMSFQQREASLVVVLTPAGEVVAATERPVPYSQAQLARFAGAASSTPDVRRDEPSTPRTAAGGSKVRRLTQRNSGPDGENYVLLIEVSDIFFEAQAASVIWTGLAVMLIGPLTTMGASWIAARLALRPLERARSMASGFFPDTIRADAPPQTDIPSELGPLSKELGQARARLRTALTSQDSLIAMLSHELRTPIAVMLAESDLLTRRSASDDIRQYIRSVREELRKLNSAITTFSQLSRMRLGAPATRTGLVSLHEVFGDAVVASHPASSTAKVAVQVMLSEAESPPMVVGDASLLVHMTRSILQRCIGCAAPGTPITIGVSRAESFWVVCISGRRAESSDSSAHASRPAPSGFDAFDPAAVEPEDRELSVGASVARGIVELHAGSIHHDISPDGHYRISIRLPAAVESDHALAGPPSADDARDNRRADADERAPTTLHRGD